MSSHDQNTVGAPVAHKARGSLHAIVKLNADPVSFWADYVYLDSDPHTLRFFGNMTHGDQSVSTIEVRLVADTQSGDYVIGGEGGDKILGIIYMPIIHQHYLAKTGTLNFNITEDRKLVSGQVKFTTVEIAGKAYDVEAEFLIWDRD